MVSVTVLRKDIYIMATNNQIIEQQNNHIAVLLEVISDLKNEARITEADNSGLRKSRDNWKKQYLDLLESTVLDNDN